MKKFLFLVLAVLMCGQAFATEKDINDRDIFLSTPSEVELPIIMYHLITERPKYIGKYGVTPAELEEDLIFLKESGYTTVTMTEVINFVENGVALPQKPIVLTFDDGNTSDHSFLLPLLEKYDMRAVIAIIGDATDKYTAERPEGKYPNLTWRQVKELHESGYVEVQSHGYNIHGKLGGGKRKGETAEAYQSRLIQDLQKLQDLCKQHLDYMPNTFIYPLGIVSEGSRAVLENIGILASLGCEEGVNVLQYNNRNCLFQMHRYNRPSGESVASIIARVL